MYNTVNESQVTVYVLPVLDKMVMLNTKKMRETAITYGKPVETETSEGLLLPLELATTIGEGRVYECITTVSADCKTTSDKARESEKQFKKWAEARGYQVELYQDLDHQLKGVDAKISTIDKSMTVQIKYDAIAHKSKNLYVETAEINPSKAH